MLYVLHYVHLFLHACHALIVSTQVTHLHSRGGLTGAVQLKQLATDYSQQKHTTWAGRGQIIIAQSKANCLSCTVPVVPPLPTWGPHVSGYTTSHLINSYGTVLTFQTAGGCFGW